MATFVHNARFGADGYSHYWSVNDKQEITQVDKVWMEKIGSAPNNGTSNKQKHVATFKIGQKVKVLFENEGFFPGTIKKFHLGNDVPLSATVTGAAKGKRWSYQVPIASLDLLKA